MDESTVQYFYSDLIYKIEQRKKTNLQIQLLIITRIIGKNITLKIATIIHHTYYIHIRVLIIDLKML